MSASGRDKCSYLEEKQALALACELAQPLKSAGCSCGAAKALLPSTQHNSLPLQVQGIPHPLTFTLTYSVHRHTCRENTHI